MAFDAYIKFRTPPLNGEVTLKSTYKVDAVGDGNNFWIDMEEYGFSTTMPVSQARSSGTGAATTGKGKLEPFTLKKFVDATSTSLAFHAAAGTVFKEIVVQVFASLAKADGSTHEPFQFLTIVMNGAVINSCKISGGGGDDLPTEDISIAYGAILYKYIPFKADVTTGAISKEPMVRFDWNTIINTGKK